jgi:hypothetical protein
MRWRIDFHQHIAATDRVGSTRYRAYLEILASLHYMRCAKRDEYRQHASRRVSRLFAVGHELLLLNAKARRYVEIQAVSTLAVHRSR